MFDAEIKWCGLDLGQSQQNHQYSENKPTTNTAQGVCLAGSMTYALAPHQSLPSPIFASALDLYHHVRQTGIL